MANEAWRVSPALRLQPEPTRSEQRFVERTTSAVLQRYRAALADRREARHAFDTALIEYRRRVPHAPDHLARLAVAEIIAHETEAGTVVG